MLRSRPFLLHSRFFSFSSRNALPGWKPQPQGRVWIQAQQLWDLPHASDELPKKVGGNAVPGEAPGTCESWISGPAASHLSESLSCPLHVEEAAPESQELPTPTVMRTGSRGTSGMPHLATCCFPRLRYSTTRCSRAGSEPTLLGP